MKTVTAKVNQILLNRGADLCFMGEHVYVPFGNFAAKDVPAALETLGADSIVVEYHTVSDPKARERDRKKFSKRLAGLGDGWVIGPWANKTVDGHVFDDVMNCTIERKAP